MNKSIFSQKLNRQIWIFSYLIFFFILLFVIPIVSAGLFEMKQNDFEVGSIFLKISLESQGETFADLKIKNFEKPGNFLISVKNLESTFIIDDNKFELGVNEEKNIRIHIKSNGEKPGIYIGKILVSNGIQDKEVPVILEIQSKEVIFDSTLNLYPPGKEIFPGEKLTADIKFFDLTDFGKSNVLVEYAIMDFDGILLASDSENLVIDEKLDYSKSFDIPENRGIGSYVLSVIVNYKNSTGISSRVFEVEKEKKDINLSNTFVIVFGFGFLLVVAVFIMFSSFLYRDRTLNELQKMYRKEAKFERIKIQAKKREDMRKLKNSYERKFYLRKINEVRKNRLIMLKQMHNQRVIQYKNAKKHYKLINRTKYKTRYKTKCKIKYKHVDVLKSMVNKWKKQGYDTSLLDKKYALPNVASIKQEIKKFKKRGYDTSVLEKHR